MTTQGFLVELHVESAGDFRLDVAVVRRRNLFLFTVDEAQRPVSVGSRGCERVLFTTEGVACNIASTWNFCGKLRKVARWSVREIAPGKLLKQFAAVRHASKFSCAFFFLFFNSKATPRFFIVEFASTKHFDLFHSSCVHLLDCPKQLAISFDKLQR